MDKDFQKKLLATFWIETRERLSAISSGLLHLEKEPAAEAQREIVETVFREAHSMKGAARAVNMVEIEAVSHALESVFAALKNRQIVASPELYDLLHQTVDSIASRVGTPVTDAAGSGSRFKTLIQRLTGALASPPPGEAPVKGDPVAPAPLDKPVTDRTVRIATTKLDSVMLQAEEMVTAKLAVAQRAADLAEIVSSLAAWEKEWKKAQPALRRMRKAGRSSETADTAATTSILLGLVDRQHAFLRTMRQKVTDVANAAGQDRHSLGMMVDNVLDQTRKALMLPFSELLEILPKAVRDLTRDQGKNVVLTVTGESLEIDRRVLEVMKDPLLHLVRNCVDHGIERPEERQRKNKPPQGTISIAVTLIDGRHIELAISDDGGGIDVSRIREAAVNLGLVTREDAADMAEQESFSLMFNSGLSTSPMITDISGRGLGLAIVREKVEEVGGTITVESATGRGTTFSITLPATISTFHGVLVQAGEQLFVVPTANVERVTRLKPAAIKTVGNREAIELDGAVLSFVRLAEVLDIPYREKKGDDDFIPLFVLRAGEKRIAFAADRVLGEQEVLVKNLGRQLSRVRNISGATVLGTGKVVPILHCGDLLKSAVKVSTGPGAGLHAPEQEEAAHRSVLVVEDSITARTLLKNILQSAGYQVATAVDGMDALTLLGTQDIDLVVSDVDMPRMNGFELTSKIRNSRELADLPVVLVTSLDSREDRERGVEAGANAYIVKSSFDQSNLLEAIQRLI